MAAQVKKSKKSMSEVTAKLAKSAKSSDDVREVVTNTGAAKQASSIAAAMAAMVTKKKGVEGIVGVLSEDTLPAVTEWLSSGIPTIDKLLGGGWAVGRISEVYGPEACGKSAQGHLAAADATRRGGLVLHVDCEWALDRERMQSSDIIMEQVILAHPDYIEQGGAMVLEFLDRIEQDPPAGPSLILWDSIPACPSKAEWDDNIDDGNTLVAAQARAYKKLLTKIYGRIGRNRVHMMWINQERVDITSRKGGFGGPARKTPGPTEIKYMASQRVRCSQAFGYVRRVGDDVVGYTLRMTTEKARLTPPMRKCDWVLMFDHGPSLVWSLWQAFDICKVLKKVSASSQSYTVPWRKLKFTKSKWEAMMGDAEFRRSALEAVADLPPNISRGFADK